MVSMLNGEYVLIDIIAYRLVQAEYYLPFFAVVGV